MNCMITDLSGRVLWQQVVYTDTADAIQFDVQKLHAGSYMLGIINNGKSGVVQFVVER
ncbi:MAG: T9SS type A sorting domain-containing protein [Saprospiraceae bacterium]